MKLLWLGHNLAFPPKGGALQRNYNLLRQAASKAEVHFLGFDQPVTRPPDISQADCIKALLGFCASADWIPLSQDKTGIHRYKTALQGLLSGRPYEVEWLRARRFGERLSRLIETHQFDVVHFDTLGLGQYITFAGNRAMVLNHHDVQSALMARRMDNEKNCLLKRYWKLEMQRVRQMEVEWGRTVDINIVCSDDEARLLVQDHRNMNTAVVPNGVDIEFFLPRKDPGGHTLLFCGTLDMYPNQHAVAYFLDSVWPLLRSRHPATEMYIVGKNPPDWLKKRASTDDRIYVTGFVDDVRPYFQKATVFACPIQEGGGTRLKILDSLAMGVPVVATSFACLGLQVEAEREVLIADDPTSFARQIDRLLDSAELRGRLAYAGRQVVERQYAWPVVGGILMNVYRRAFEINAGRVCR